MRPWFRTLPLLALGPALGIGMGTGCQKNTIELETDPGIDDDEDSGELTTTDGSPPSDGSTTDDTGPAPVGPQLLLLAIDTPLAQGLPFQALINATPGTGTVDLTLQFLSLDIGSTTTPRQPVGDVYAYPALPVDATGTFYWDTGVILIPGAANPITGSDIVASIQANVAPVGTPAYCGAVGGAVTSPIQTTLDGSTHAMTVISDVASLPVDFPVACP